MSVSKKPMPKDEFLSGIHLGETKDMYITLPKLFIDFPSPDSHAHPGYEFMIPLTDMPYLNINGKAVFGLKDHVLPVNPMQEHGVTEPMEKVRFIDILITEDFLLQSAHDVYRHETLKFDSGNYPISAQLKSFIMDFINESIRNQPGKVLLLQSLSSTIAILLLRELKSNLSNVEEKNKHADYHKIKLIEEYIRENYKTDFLLDDLANIAKMSKFHFIRVFKNQTGKTPYEYLLDIRLDKAKSLLSQKNMTVIEVCLESGFNSLSNFTTLFKKKTGVTPTYYKSIMI